MPLRHDRPDRSRTADKAVLLAIALLTLVYVACVLILDGEVIFPLG